MYWFIMSEYTESADYIDNLMCWLEFMRYRMMLNTPSFNKEQTSVVTAQLCK